MGHFSKFKYWSQELPGSIVDPLETTQSAGVLIRGNFTYTSPSNKAGPFQILTQMHHIKVKELREVRVKVFKDITALPAGRDDSLDPSLLERFHIEMEKFLKGLLISSPNEVMTTTPFIWQYNRLDTERVEGFYVSMAMFTKLNFMSEKKVSK